MTQTEKVKTTTTKKKHLPICINIANHILHVNLANSHTNNISMAEKMFRLTDMIDSTSTELSVELLGPKAPEVLDGEGPEM